MRGLDLLEVNQVVLRPVVEKLRHGEPAVLRMPSVLPSLTHSSAPLSPSSATKKSVPFRSVNSVGKESASPGSMSVTIRVPAAVPSVLHSSRPFTPLSAAPVLLAWAIACFGAEQYDRALEGVIDSPRILLPANRMVEIDRMLRLAADKPKATTVEGLGWYTTQTIDA